MEIKRWDIVVYDCEDENDRQLLLVLKADTNCKNHNDDLITVIEIWNNNEYVYFRKHLILVQKTFNEWERIVSIVSWIIYTYKSNYEYNNIYLRLSDYNLLMDHEWKDKLIDKESIKKCIFNKWDIVKYISWSNIYKVIDIKVEQYGRYLISIEHSKTHHVFEAFESKLESIKTKWDNITIKDSQTFVNQLQSKITNDFADSMAYAINNIYDWLKWFQAWLSKSILDEAMNAIWPCWASTPVWTVTVDSNNNILDVNIPKPMSKYNEVIITKFFSDENNINKIEEICDKLNTSLSMLWEAGNDIKNKFDKVQKLLIDINSHVANSDIKAIKEDLKIYDSYLEFIDNYSQNKISDLSTNKIKVSKSAEEYFNSIILW